MRVPHRRRGRITIHVCVRPHAQFELCICRRGHGTLPAHQLLPLPLAHLPRCALRWRSTRPRTFRTGALGKQPCARLPPVRPTDDVPPAHPPAGPPVPAGLAAHGHPAQRWNHRGSAQRMALHLSEVKDEHDALAALTAPRWLPGSRLLILRLRRGVGRADGGGLPQRGALEVGRAVRGPDEVEPSGVVFGRQRAAAAGRGVTLLPAQTERTPTSSLALLLALCLPCQSLSVSLLSSVCS